MSSEATGPRGSSAEREQRRAETGVAPHVSNPPLAVGVTGTLPTLASSPHGAPGQVEPDFFDSHGEHEEGPAVSGVSGNLPLVHQLLSEAPSILGSDEFDEIYDDGDTLTTDDSVQDPRFGEGFSDFSRNLSLVNLKLTSKLKT